MEKAGLRKAGQRRGVDMRLVLVVKARDHSRQHAGIGSVHLARDEREAHAGHWIHAECAQHADMRVPGPDEYDVLQYWYGGSLHVARLSVFMLLVRRQAWSLASKCVVTAAVGATGHRSARRDRPSQP